LNSANIIQANKLNFANNNDIQNFRIIDDVIYLAKASGVSYFHIVENLYNNELDEITNIINIELLNTKNNISVINDNVFLIDDNDKAKFITIAEQQIYNNYIQSIYINDKDDISKINQYNNNTFIVNGINGDISSTYNITYNTDNSIQIIDNECSIEEFNRGSDLSIDNKQVVKILGNNLYLTNNGSIYDVYYTASDNLTNAI
jgi:hypothetical protein